MPDPILASIAAALAARSATALYDLVKRKFTGREDATEALAAASGTAPDSPEVAAVAEHLAAATAADPEFDEELRRTYSASADRGGVVNQITGNVTGKVVQARDVEGGISF